MLSGVGWHIAYVILLTVAVGFYEIYGVPNGLPDIALPGLGAPFGMITFALSLLLVHLKKRRAAAGDEQAA